MARFSSPSRSSRRGVYREPSRLAYQQRQRRPQVRTWTRPVQGVVWTVEVDWDGDGFGTTPEDDITADFLHRASPTFEFGRDQERSLSPMTSGRGNGEIDNRSRRYSPDNVDSPLHDRILPARPFRFQGRLNGVNFTIFRGQFDDYKLRVRQDQRSVQMSVLDPIAMLKGTSISTRLYSGIRTGEAIGYVLDALGVPEDARDLDPGATVIRWWWEHDRDAFSAISDLIESEGPGATLHADEAGRYVFRDRHHRLLNEASTLPQAFFEPGTDLTPEDMELDLGWRDIINAISIKVEEREPAKNVEVVWESEDARSIGSGETIELTVELNDPLWDPVPGYNYPTLDYVLVAGEYPVPEIVQMSAQSYKITFSGLFGAGVISNIQMFGQPVEVARSFQVELADQASIDKYGHRDPVQHKAPWAGVHDAQAIAELVLGARAERLPTATITLISGTRESSPLLLQQLSRNLSDRVHIREPESCVDYGFYLQRIKQRISDGGMLLTTDFTLEKAATQAANVFRFDDADHGFDRGVFAATGLDDPQTLFIFDRAGRGFGDGLFAS
ncbi:hypothetical protein [Actinomadura sp. 21ATH]|uniref:hypothetical protein n=1 Tax=Actinomadura sp. 21ATH TaxID=1735444 RepID=UPI0035C17217